MTNIFGITNNSLDNFINLLKEIPEDFSFFILEEDIKNDLPKSDIYIIPSFKIMIKYKKLLNKRKGVLIVFDTLNLLNSIKNISILDLIVNSLFPPTSLKKKSLIPIIKSLNNKKSIIILIKNKDLIKETIKQEKEGKFLDKFNTLIYSMPSQDQNYVRGIIIKYLYGDIELEKFKKDLKTLLKKTKKINSYYENLCNFLESSIGKNLYDATQESASIFAKELTPSYKDISLKYNIDPDELRYLYKLYKEQ